LGRRVQKKPKEKKKKKKKASEKSDKKKKKPSTMRTGFSLGILVASAASARAGSSSHHGLNDMVGPVERLAPLLFPNGPEGETQDIALRRASMPASVTALPPSFDAREAWPSCVPPVLNQGDCGSVSGGVWGVYF
jgi:hypothetical protein